MNIKNILLKTLYFFIGLSILFNFNITVFSFEDDEYTWSKENSSISTSSIDTSSATLSSDNSLNLQSGSAILIDQKTGQILYEHNCHEQLRPASVTKVMTLLLIMEAIDSGQISLNDKVPCSEKASSMGGSQVWLTTTETLTVNDMLKCICVVSANDCTVAMAEYLCGSTDAFVAKMNQRAKELGMNDTCFKNCHGIDEDGHVSSAYDIALMSKELLNNHPSIKNYTTIWMDSIRDGTSQLVSTNKLVRNYEGCTGLKTGSTSLALYNLSASATRNDLSLIAVIMKAPTTALRFSEAKSLLDYGFSNYSSVKLSNANKIVKTVSVNKGTENSVNAIFSNSTNYTITKGQSSKISSKVNIPDSVDAPISKGQKIGEVQYYIDDKLIQTSDIIADHAVTRNTFINMSTFVIKKWFNLLRK